MPFLFRKDYAWGVVAVWQIEESEQELVPFVTRDDLESVEAMRSSTKRVERLSWRALLRLVFPDVGDVTYNTLGAPCVEGLFLSVSHCCDYAVLVASSTIRCGIDVESVGRNFENVCSRYLSDKEGKAIGLIEVEGQDRTNLLCQAWCAKEAMYKYAGRDGLDFIENLQLTHLNGDHIGGFIHYDGAKTELTMKLFKLNDSFMVVIGEFFGV